MLSFLFILWSEDSFLGCPRENFYGVFRHQLVGGGVFIILFEPGTKPWIWGTYSNLEDPILAIETTQWGNSVPTPAHWLSHLLNTRRKGTAALYDPLSSDQTSRKGAVVGNYPLELSPSSPRGRGPIGPPRFFENHYEPILYEELATLHTYRSDQCNQFDNLWHNFDFGSGRRAMTSLLNSCKAKIVHKTRLMKPRCNSASRRAISSF